MGKTFVMGDVHGAYRALRQVLERSSFDYENDTLIFLGDIADGWPETKQAVDELLKIRNLKYIFGNHDFWTLEWMETGHADDIWIDQGGKATIKSYSKETIPASHKNLLSASLPYFISNEKLFVHAGIDPMMPLENQTLSTFLWDRNLVRMAMDFEQKGIKRDFTTFSEIYVGHTPISGGRPYKACNVWMMDTGAGWTGVLSIMDLETQEYFTSDPVPSLYPGVEGRKRPR